jgi:hypothetical protein
MEHYDYQYSGGARILRVTEPAPNVYEVFYLDNDGTDIVNDGEKIYGLAQLLKLIYSLRDEQLCDECYRRASVARLVKKIAQQKEENQ